MSSDWQWQKPLVTVCYIPKAFDFLCHATAETSCVVVIVSPLIQDQVRVMTMRKINAVYDGKVDNKLEADICSGTLFFSPESLLVESRWRVCIRALLIVRDWQNWFVDEAHCVQKW